MATTGRWGRRHARRIVGAAIAATLVVSVTGIGPVPPVQCLWERMDGWIVEIPEDSLTPQGVKRSVGGQTRCVNVEVGVVDWNLVPEGQLAVRPPGPKVSIDGDRTIQLWVEGAPDEATDPCRPLEPQEIPIVPPDGHSETLPGVGRDPDPERERDVRPGSSPPPGCPGGPQRVL